MNDAVVLDTDVVSYILKKDTRAQLYIPHLTGKIVVVSFMTLAELYRWAEERHWGEHRKQQMEQHVRNFVLFGFNRDLCRTWAQVMARTRRNGRQLSCADGWIAATAILYDLPLLTHNRRDFQHVPGLRLASEEPPEPTLNGSH